MSNKRLQTIELMDTVRPSATASRASRLPAFIGSPADAAQRLDKLALGVVGVGSVGGNLALHLARLQVGRLVLCDPAQYKPESLLTQPIPPDAVGETKAAYIARLCKSLSPRTTVQAFVGPFQDLDWIELADLDGILLAGDNLALEVAVGQVCLHLGLPLIHASVDGPTLVAQVRFFGKPAEDGACPACLFGQAEWDHLHRETAFKCELSAEGDPIRQNLAQPTMSVSFLCSTAADLALMQLLRHVLGLGRPVQGTLLEYCAFTHRTNSSEMRRNPDCPCDHQVWRRHAAPGPLQCLSLGELMAMTAIEAPRFMVDGHRFAEAAACRCGHVDPLSRFITGNQDVGKCPRCEGPLYPQPFRDHESVPLNLAGAYIDRPLAELGVRAARWVLVRGDDAAMLIRPSQE